MPNPPAFESQAGDDAFLEHVLRVMARVSVGDLSARVQIPVLMPRDSMGYKLAAGLNVLINDLENNQEARIRALAEEALSKSEEVRQAAIDVQELLRFIRDSSQD